MSYEIEWGIHRACLRLVRLIGTVFRLVMALIVFLFIPFIFLVFWFSEGPVKAREAGRVAWEVTVDVWKGTT